MNRGGGWGVLGATALFCVNKLRIGTFLPCWHGWCVGSNVCVCEGGIIALMLLSKIGVL